jgi:hypothetical protein
MSFTSLPYPSGTPSSAPYSNTEIITYTPQTSASPQVIVSYVPMQTTYSTSPVGLPYISGQGTSFLSNISNDALYGIISAVGFVVLYTIVSLCYYYNAYKKEKKKVKRLSEFQVNTQYNNSRNVLNSLNSL